VGLYLSNQCLNHLKWCTKIKKCRSRKIFYAATKVRFQAQIAKNSRPIPTQWHPPCIRRLTSKENSSVRLPPSPTNAPAPPTAKPLRPQPMLASTSLFKARRGTLRPPACSQASSPLFSIAYASLLLLLSASPPATVTSACSMGRGDVALLGRLPARVLPWALAELPPMTIAFHQSATTLQRWNPPAAALCRAHACACAPVPASSYVRALPSLRSRDRPPRSGASPHATAAICPVHAQARGRRWVPEPMTSGPRDGCECAENFRFMYCVQKIISWVW
jgi:hypothetical protein